MGRLVVSNLAKSESDPDEQKAPHLEFNVAKTLHNARSSCISEPALDASMDHALPGVPSRVLLQMKGSRLKGQLGR